MASSREISGRGCELYCERSLSANLQVYFMSQRRSEWFSRAASHNSVISVSCSIVLIFVLSLLLANYDLVENFLIYFEINYSKCRYLNWLIATLELTACRKLVLGTRSKVQMMQFK